MAFEYIYVDLDGKEQFVLNVEPEHMDACTAWADMLVDDGFTVYKTWITM